MDMHAFRQRVERVGLYILSAQGSPVPSTLLLTEYKLPQRDSDKASLALEEISGQGWESRWENSEFFCLFPQLFREPIDLHGLRELLRGTVLGYNC